MVSSHSSQIRAFQPQDLEPIVDLWNRCLPHDPMTVDRFWRLFLLDPNFNPGSAFVAEAGDRPIGFLMAMHPRGPFGNTPSDLNQGYITAFFVAPECRRQGVGRVLMTSGLDVLRMNGCHRVTCNGYAPYYAFPGVDIEYAEAIGFMAAMGFQPFSEAVAMSLSFDGVQVPDDVAERRKAFAADGLIVRWFEIADTLPLLKFAEKQFPEWRPSLILGLQRDNRDVMVAVQGDEVFGFAQWQNPLTDPPNGATGRFGPFGVHQDMRGKGLGAVIFCSLIDQVAARGATDLWFGWAGGRNLSFYERAGCRVTRRYRLFKLDLSS